MQAMVDSMEFRPALMQFVNGKTVEGKEEWPQRRTEILDILSREAFGYLPPKPQKVTSSLEAKNERICAGHGFMESRRIYFDTPKGMFSFPYKLVLPVKKEKVPVLVYIHFQPDFLDDLIPIEEIVDRGYGVAAVYGQSMTSDDNNLSSLLYGMFDRPTDGTGYGKISIWAYGLSRIVDTLMERPEVDTDRIGVIGHSRFGKTALWCGANDDRIKYVIANASGCAGASYEREKEDGSETSRLIYQRFPYWFCENYQKYGDKAEEMPFDSHFLLAAACPRYVMIGSCSLDAWANPASEQRGCMGASPAWNLFGRPGFAAPDRNCEIGEAFQDGDISYHLKDGVHHLGRTDWNRYIDFMERNK